MSLWIMKEYVLSAETLLEESGSGGNSSSEDEGEAVEKEPSVPDVFHFYSFLRRHPLVHCQQQTAYPDQAKRRKHLRLCMNGVCQVGGGYGLGYGLGSALSGYGLGGMGGYGLGGYGLGGMGGYGGYGLGGMGYGSALYGGLGGAGTGTFGLMAAANKLCADTVDCYSGQICQAGRCSFQSGGYGALGALGGYGGLGGAYGGYGGVGYGNDPALASLYSPYGLSSLSYRQSGLQPCTLMQDCPNGQICVNGYCSESSGLWRLTAVQAGQKLCHRCHLPSGPLLHGRHLCQGLFHANSTCGLGFMCPFGMTCHFGRCSPTSSSLLAYGKKRKK